MSGTSLDGIDIVCVNFILGEKWDFSITAAQTFQYSTLWQKKLSKLYFESKEVIFKEDLESIFGKRPWDKEEKVTLNPSNTQKTLEVKDKKPEQSKKNEEKPVQ